MYNEADTRAKLIDPRLHAAGWDEKRIKRDHPFTKADYLLHYNPALPLAVVEAKEEVVHPVDGLQRQAKRYSQKFLRGQRRWAPRCITSARTTVRGTSS